MMETCVPLQRQSEMIRQTEIKVTDCLTYCKKIVSMETLVLTVSAIVAIAVVVSNICYFK